MNKELYPALIEYIYRYYAHLQTDNEKLAGKTVMYNDKGLNEKYLQFIKLKRWYSDEPHIQAMVANGLEDFKLNVVVRIFNEHRNQLDLNLCPKCSKLTRTPWAKQCRFCLHDWH